MASLTVVTSILTNVIQSERPDLQPTLDWSSARFNDYLQKCPTPDQIRRWHATFMTTIVESEDTALGRLCQGVADCIIRAIGKLEGLRLCSARDSASLSRRAVLSSLEDVIAAFNEFYIVSSNDDFGRPQVRDVVLAYLRQTYDLMITIRWVLEPCDDDHDWLKEDTNYLQNTNLQNFKFDSAAEYPKQTDSLSTEEIIVPYAEVPPNCKPAFPQPPILVLIRGPYGTRIQRNRFCDRN